MTYKLEFLPSALKEWDKLGHTCSGSRLKTRRLAFIPFFGSDYLQMTERSGSH
jgi:mRNA-degrading endonuclease RelE of RelBE toxin-antitoxin system